MTQVQPKATGKTPRPMSIPVPTVREATRWVIERREKTLRDLEKH